MRTEQQMMEQILSFAKADERIRAVGMEGSRTNKNVPKDDFQDFDITFIVTDMDSFKANDGWLEAFGERRMMQKPEAMALFPPEMGNWFSYLMLFKDGRRMDLTLVPLEELELYLNSEGLLTVLLDKDGRVTAPPVPTDQEFHVKKPSAAFYDDCCNEFWNTSGYVVRGLCRKEFLFAAHHLDSIVRANLLLMFEWKVGLETDFSLSVGKNGKYLDRYLSAETWERLLSTYRCDSLPHLWEALFQCFSLFREASHAVGDALHYPYPYYDGAMTEYAEELFQRYGHNG